MDVINARQMEKGNYVTQVQFRAVRRMGGIELGSVAKMPENKADTPKRKYLVWSDGDEVKVMDMGIDYHTNVKEQAVVKVERGEDGKL
jgi:hypothetical protein